MIWAKRLPITYIRKTHNILVALLPLLISFRMKIPIICNIRCYYQTLIFWLSVPALYINLYFIFYCHYCPFNLVMIFNILKWKWQFLYSLNCIISSVKKIHKTVKLTINVWKCEKKLKFTYKKAADSIVVLTNSQR